MGICWPCVLSKIAVLLPLLAPLVVTIAAALGVKLAYRRKRKAFRSWKAPFGHVLVDFRHVLTDKEIASIKEHWDLQWGLTDKNDEEAEC